MLLRETASLLNRARLSVIMLVIMMLPSVVFSANSAQSKITVTVGEAAKISGIDDWVIGIHTADESLGAYWEYNWDYECVFSSTGAYSVELTSQNGVSPMVLKSASGDEMDYEVWAYVKQGASHSIKGPYRAANFTIPNLTGSDSQTCQGEGYGGHNLFFAALVRRTSFDPAPSGIYRDQMVITVRPE